LTSAQKAPAALYLVALLWVNAYICRDLFFTEYTGHTNSIQGLWISLAGLAGEHWYRPSWWPFHDGGMPFEHAYMPLAPGITAVYAKVAGCSPMRAFNAITGIVYCLGPLTLFLMAWQMTRAPGYSFWAALAYSLTSPARALIPDPNFNPAFFWTSRRLYTMVVWDDVPHGAAVCLIPLIVLFLTLSINRRRPIYYLLTGVCMALAVLASVFGAVAILLSVICLLFVLPREQLRSNLILVVAIGALAYLAICAFLPPSLIATIRSNQQLYPEDRWSTDSFTALSAVALGWAVVWTVLRRATDDRWLRFFVLFALLTSSIPLLDAYANRHFLPQAGRYQPEMEIAIALALVFALRPAAERLPRGVRIALACLLLSIAGEQVVRHRRYAKDVIASHDMTRAIEYRVAQWMNQNVPGQRVMVPGSIAQWFNVWSRNPQLSGGSYSTTPNQSQQKAMAEILTSPEAATSILWLKAFGVQAVTVSGPQSTEFWKPYRNPKKFDGLLPLLWREDDVTIYKKVPQRTLSLAHVIPPAVSTLEAYVAALDDPSAPVAEMNWDGFRRATIRTVAHTDQVVSIQTTYHPGWHARANNRPVEIRRDELGFLRIRPECEGPCEIELNYDGGWEYKPCRLLSALTILGVGVLGIIYNPFKSNV
jgi:hypothetical protein